MSEKSDADEGIKRRSKKKELKFKENNDQNKEKLKESSDYENIIENIVRKEINFRNNQELRVNLKETERNIIYETDKAKKK